MAANFKSNLPAAAERSVFTMSVRREIDAPIERVWDVLTDLPRYHEWNPFVRAMTIVSASKQAEADQTLAEGKHLLMKCHIPPTMDDSQVGFRGVQKPLEIVTVVDAENYRLSWINVDFPNWALRAQRWQVLSTISAGDGIGETKTLYETEELFGGVLAYVVDLFIGQNLRKAFDGFADGLKRRSEEA